MAKKQGFDSKKCLKRFEIERDFMLKRSWHIQDLINEGILF